MEDKIYTFVKDPQECGNIEACKFVGNIFQTKDPSVAEKLRKSSTFNKSVREVTDIVEEAESEQDPIVEITDASDYEKMNYFAIVKIAKEKGVNPKNEAGANYKKDELIAMLMGK